MVDWRAVRVGSTTAQRRLSVEWYLKRGAGQVRADHPARTWVERQEGRAEVRKIPPLARVNAEEGTQGWAGRKSKKLTDGSRAVNMHNLGRHFVERVLDVRRTPTTDQSAGREGETLQFLAQVRGWQGVQAAARKERLLKLNDWSLGHHLTQAAGTDIFFIPQDHYSRAEPENGESGWWYRVREVAQCRQCMVCCRRKLRAEFTGEDWNKQRPVKCSQCKGDGQRSASRGQNRRKHKRARRDSQGGRDKGCHQSMVQDGEEADSGEPRTPWLRRAEPGQKMRKGGTREQIE